MGKTGYVHKPSPGYAKEPEPQIQQTNLKDVEKKSKLENVLGVCTCKIIQTCKVFVVIEFRKSTIVVGFMGTTRYVHKPSPGYAKEPEPQIQQTNLNLSLIQKIRKRAGCVHVQKNSNLQSFHRP